MELQEQLQSQIGSMLWDSFPHSLSVEYFVYPYHKATQALIGLTLPLCEALQYAFPAFW